MDSEEKIAYTESPVFWWRRTKGSHTFSPLNSGMHYDASFVITLFVRATGYVLVEGKTIPFSDGDLLMISPREFHRSFVNACPDHERITLHIDPSLAAAFGVDPAVLFAAFLDRQPGEGNVIPAALVRRWEIDRLFADFRLPEEDDPAAELVMRCRAAEILVRLGRATRQNVEAPEGYCLNPTVERVIRYINAHLCEEVSTAALAKEVAVDKSYLCRTFKKHTGVPIHEYVTQKRITRALRLLGEGASCTKACFDSGFTNYTGFYQAVCRCTGKPPRAHGDKVKNNDPDRV